MRQTPGQPLTAVLFAQESTAAGLIDQRQTAMNLRNRKSTPLKVEFVPLARLKPHPRNYRSHPDDQIEHLMESIRRNGFYRNIVVAHGDVILAGHGVVEAARRLGVDQVPVIRLDIAADSPAAMKILAGDNEIARLAEVDDTSLVRLLTEIKDIDLQSLLGTGFTDQSLAALMHITKPPDQLLHHDENAEWMGLPQFEPGQSEDSFSKIIVTFRNVDDRKEFCRVLGIRELDKPSWQTMWPAKEREDLSSIKVQA